MTADRIPPETVESAVQQVLGLLEETTIRPETVIGDMTTSLRPVVLNALQARFGPGLRVPDNATLRDAVAALLEAGGDQSKVEARGSGRAEGVFTRLRPIVPGDIEMAYLAATDPIRGSLWHYRGQTPSRQEFEANFFNGTYAMFGVEAKETGAPQGLVHAYDHSPAARHLKLAYQRFPLRPEHRAPGALTEGMVLLIEHVLSTTPLNKIYFEVPASNAELPMALDVEEEARQVAYYFREGQYEDKIIYSFAGDKARSFLRACREFLELNP